MSDHHKWDYYEAINYPVPLPEGEVYVYYFDGTRFVDIRFLDIMNDGGVKIEHDKA